MPTADNLDLAEMFWPHGWTDDAIRRLAIRHEATTRMVETPQLIRAAVEYRRLAHAQHAELVELRALRDRGVEALQICRQAWMTPGVGIGFRDLTNCLEALTGEAAGGGE